MSEALHFVPISVATLLPSAAVGLDLYQRVDESGAIVLYRGGEFPLTHADIYRLRKRGVTRLLIRKRSAADYQKYLRTLASTDGENSGSTPARVGAMNEVVRDVMSQLFENADVGETVEKATTLGKLVCDVILEKDFQIGDLFNVLYHDYGTFTHSTNVAFYAGILASELGHSSTEVRAIATGGFLHDLGKLEIPDAILSKPGRLDESEFAVIKTHSLLGYRRLAYREDLCEGQLMMTYQHHERLDGSGYPVGCVADEIHPWAKLCSVVDVFEALTSQRPYRTPMTQECAIGILERDSGIAFDKEVLKCWTMLIRQGLKN